VFTYKQITLKSPDIVNYDLKGAKKKSAGAQRLAGLPLFGNDLYCCLLTITNQASF